MADEMVKIRLKASGKTVNIPKQMHDIGDAISIRQYAVESGQATPEEAGVSQEFRPEANALESAGVNAIRTVLDFGSNIKQGIAELSGDDVTARQLMNEQAQRERLTRPTREDHPVASFVGSSVPFFAVPGGKVAQAGFGALEGALQGDTPIQRLTGGAVGLTAGLAGQKFGDYLGQRIQNFGQRMTGNVNANARRELIGAGVPLSLSQRTDNIISEPLSRFFERGRFVWTGNQPASAAQQRKITELIGDALGINAKKLTREVLGEAASNNKAVFQSAARRIGNRIIPDQQMLQDITLAAQRFDNVGSDSAQVKRVFKSFIDAVTDPNGINPSVYLHLRSNLSAATTKSDIETSALVDAIGAMDDQLARLVPDLADDLVTARDRFRLLLAIRRGASLSPQGDININTFTKNLERVFTDFDVGKPLPNSLRGAGEAVAALNQVVVPFRSSGTTENLGALALPGGAAADPSALLRFLMGAAAPFAGGGTGGLIGGGAARAGSSSLLSELQGREF